MKREARDKAYMIRLTVTERDLFDGAAQNVGLTLSNWMRMTLLRQVKTENSKRGEPNAAETRKA